MQSHPRVAKFFAPKYLWTTIALIFVCGPLAGFDQVQIPHWDAGVRNGIPDIEVTKSLTAEDLANNAQMIIQKALDELATPGALLLPEGEFTIQEPIRLRSGVVLRGMGAGKTILRAEIASKGDFDPNDRPAMGAIRIEGNRHTKTVELIDGFHRGSTSIETKEPVHFKSGDWILIFSENDPELMYTDERWERDWAQQLLAQIVRVTKVDHNTVSFDTPLRLTLKSSLNPRVRQIKPIENAGIENLTVYRADNLNDNIIGIEAAVNSWVRGSETINATRSHIWINYSRFITIESNHTHRAQHFGGGGQGYGIVTGNVAVDCLIQDNILHQFRHSLMTKAGSNGNVFAYNYSFDRRREPVGAPLLCDISIHGHYSHHNLFEGNVVEHAVFADFWGPTGPRTTMFRNIVLRSIELRDHSHDALLIGNAIGPEGITTDGTSKRTVMFGNYVYEAEPAYHPVEVSQLPDSLYLSEKPSFWTESLKWPPVNPAEGLPNQRVIPAQLRYDNQTRP